MAVSTTDTYSGPYAANGVTVAFPFTFKAVSTADVAVIFRASDGSEIVADGGLFTVVLASEGGTVTFSTAPLALVGDVFVVSEPAFIQSVEFASGQPFLPSVVNEVNDRDVVRALYLKGKIDRAPQAPIGGGAEGQFPTVLPDGSWGFSSGTGNDPAFRADAASPAPDKGADLIAFRQAEGGAVTRTTKDKLNDLPIDRRDFTSLQAAVNAAGSTGRALYLGDEEFTQTTSVIIPDADLCIYGPGSGALDILFTGAGGLFVGTNLSPDSNIDIRGFRAIAGAANCGPAVSLSYGNPSGLYARTCFIDDVVAISDFADPNKYWSGGIYLKNAKTSVVENCYIHGPTADLNRTAYGFRVAGEATDVKISNCMAVSVKTGCDIIDQVEGTILNNYVAVDVLIGVAKLHTGTSEPWLSMTNWHINTRGKGIYLNNVLQVTITPGLIYCQNGSGEFIGVHVDGGDIANQDMKIAAIIDAQLGGPGMTSSTGIEIAQGNGIDADLTMRAVDTCAYFGVFAYDNIVRLLPSDFEIIADGTGLNQNNRVIANLPGNGWALPKVAGPFNPDQSNTTGKTAEVVAFGVDTVGTIKGVGGIRLVAQNANWTDSQAEILRRVGDAFVQAAIFGINGSPEGVLTALPSTMVTAVVGGVGKLFLKVSGTGNTGWVEK